jgi:hypothetical protein
LTSQPEPINLIPPETTRPDISTHCATAPVRFVIVSPDLQHIRRYQAEIPLIPVFEFGQPPLS